MCSLVFPFTYSDAHTDYFLRRIDFSYVFERRFAGIIDKGCPSARCAASGFKRNRSHSLLSLCAEHATLAREPGNKWGSCVTDVLDQFIFGKPIVDGQPADSPAVLALSNGLMLEDTESWRNYVSLSPFAYPSVEESQTVGIFAGPQPAGYDRPAGFPVRAAAGRGVPTHGRRFISPDGVYERTNCYHY